MAANNTSATLRASTVSRALAMAGVPRATFGESGFQFGFEVHQCGHYAAGVLWYWQGFMHSRNEHAREQGLAQCETALKTAGYEVQRDGWVEDCRRRVLFDE